MRSVAGRWLHGAMALVALFFFSSVAHASVAYGALSNFDTVNDTGQLCHGFEIELDDVLSTSVTYTYDYNHYGKSSIRQDNSVPAHPKVFIRWASARDAAGHYLSFTAIPAAPLPPTQGHQCTNPGVNLGCEHFGVGSSGNATAVFYNWLVDDGAGNLVHGPAVNVATPVFTYAPPAQKQFVAQVQVVVPAPPPPPVPVAEFGIAVWVKSIVTTAHSRQKIALRDLVSDDPNDLNDVNWKNGEADEVESEWDLVQREFANPAGARNEKEGKPDDLANNDDVVTRRYETYKYVGPYDPETHEALCDKNPDPGSKNPECDTDVPGVVLVGDFIGAQMAGFQPADLGLIDNVQDGQVTKPYPNRTVVVGGNAPYQATVSLGALPRGLTLASATGVLSGTPTQSGKLFSFTIDATDADNVHVSKAYTMVIAIVVRAGDVDQDGDIDLNDINAMKLRFGQPANGANDLSDVNHDGVINVLDIRKAISMCTRPKCAVQ